MSGIVGSAGGDGGGGDDEEGSLMVMVEVVAMLDGSDVIGMASSRSRVKGRESETSAKAALSSSEGSGIFEPDAVAGGVGLALALLPSGDRGVETCCITRSAAIVLGWWGVYSARWVIDLRGDDKGRKTLVAEFRVRVDRDLLCRGCPSDG